MTDTISDTELAAVIAGLPPRAGRPPGQKGTLNRSIEYKCDGCGTPTERNDLFVREVTFIRLSDKKRVRTRRIDWICGTCIVKHPDYNRQRYSASPGMRDVHAKE